ncbi:hypothetical protein [Anaerosalibacter massiliensis]|uniref:Uncharacterized protein n=1 Tax=Anaerosalibacter massiliensis TaxID=1347392 RepID=A0A9X2MHB3_9FIRM|nr:hypothetical protein [Anaerosalibacter massiliensis]MCR2043152.1 hypothetical protein [Anaerosalibacter massiliensis]
MLKIEKIEEKIELLDVEAQADPCKYKYERDKVTGTYDCLHDCTKGGKRTPYQSIAY